MAMEYIRAFLVGGLICMLVQILMDKTKMMPGRIMVLLVVSGSVLGFLGVYEPFAEWAGRERLCRCLDLEIHFGKGL